MKTIIVFASLIFVILAANDPNLWNEFKKQHTKTYKNIREERKRFSIFQSNVRIIAEHNKKYELGEETYYMGINQFTDMTDKEFESVYLSYIEGPPVNPTKVFAMPSEIAVPDAIDWRDRGVVTAVKDQALCGSCWAFSATGAVESQYAIQKGVQVTISEQELLDCSVGTCNGGSSLNVFMYVKRNGISTNESYPYTSGGGGVVGTCKKGKDSGIKVIDGVVIPQTEESLKQAVGLVGPISVYVNASNFSKYAGGIFNYPQCGQKINHAMLAVGYGTQNGLDYWIVKNSWGNRWADNGYIKMARNKNQQCGIGITQFYPIVH